MREKVVKLSEVDKIEGFSPPHHSLTTDRKLFDREDGARNFALWHGEVGVGGKAETHSHRMEQVFLVLSGKALFDVDGRRYELGEEELIFIPSFLPHSVESVGDEPLRLLIFMAPPPESFDEWKR